MTGPTSAHPTGSGSAGPDRDDDVVLYGATGFVGRLTARHLARVASGVRIALAGRDRDQLEGLKRDLGGDWPVLVVDTGDAAGLEALARATRAVSTLSTAPPRRPGPASCTAAGSTPSPRTCARSCSPKRSTPTAR